MILRIVIAAIAVVLALIAARRAIAVTPVRSNDHAEDEAATLRWRLEQALQRLKRSAH
jgi:hypothetical protein